MIYFVTAIGTDSGKTVVSAILTKALQADYWKPIQAGFPRDSDTVKDLLNNNYSVVWDEAYLLQSPMSPHAAAKIDGVKIDLNNILLPEKRIEDLVIEGAGGVLVPLNEKDVVIDIAVKFKAEVILVVNTYLGCINHTLLSAAELKRRNIKVKGIIFNGEPNEETENIILHHTGYKCLLKVKREQEITQEVISHYAIKLFDQWEA